MAAKRETALSLGRCRRPSTLSRRTRARRSSGRAGPISAAIDFVGSDASLHFAQSIVGKGGAVIIVGLMGGKFSLPVPMFPLRELTLLRLLCRQP